MGLPYFNIMAITQKPNEPTHRFLNRLGIISAQYQGVEQRYEELRWSEINKKDPVSLNPFLQLAGAAGQYEENTFNSYSGADVSIYLLFDRADIKAKYRDFYPFREIQTLSVSSARSVHPVRRLGESHVVEYTRGARTIAGTMVCVSGDRDPFAKASLKSIREKASSEPFFTDELGMFSILIICSDEYGHVSHAALSDITITNFGQTFSEGDMFLENTYTYVARFYHPLLPDPDILNRRPAKGGSNKLSKQFVNIWGLPGDKKDETSLKRNSWVRGVREGEILFPGLFTLPETRSIDNWKIKN